jgi:phosphatidylglycerophosphatase A
MNQPALIKKENITAIDRLAYWIANGVGAGLAPIAPGTFGAAEGVAIFLITNAKLGHSPMMHLALLVALNVLVFALGVWAANRTCEICGLKDPGVIVIDEVSGQLIAITPLALAPSPAGIIAAFLLFRFFDIFKPYPIRKLERLPGGLGVMADDALAGIYAAILMGAAVMFQVI